MAFFEKIDKVIEKLFNPNNNKDIDENSEFKIDYTNITVKLIDGNICTSEGEIIINKKWRDKNFVITNEKRKWLLRFYKNGAYGKKGLAKTEIQECKISELKSYIEEIEENSKVEEAFDNYSSSIVKSVIIEYEEIKEDI